MTVCSSLLIDRVAELQALFDSRDFDLSSFEEGVLDNASYFGRIFARSGGLTEAAAKVREAKKAEDAAKNAAPEYDMSDPLVVEVLDLIEKRKQAKKEKNLQVKSLLLLE